MNRPSKAFVYRHMWQRQQDTADAQPLNIGHLQATGIIKEDAVRQGNGEGASKPIAAFIEVYVKMVMAGVIQVTGAGAIEVGQISRL